MAQFVDELATYIRELEEKVASLEMRVSALEGADAAQVEKAAAKTKRELPEPGTLNFNACGFTKPKGSKRWEKGHIAFLVQYANHTPVRKTDYDYLSKVFPQRTQKAIARMLYDIRSGRVSL